VGAELKKLGANRIYAFATHGLFSGPAIERIKASNFEKVVVTNSVPLSKDKITDKIEQVSIAGLLAKAIYSVHFKCSISELFRLQENPHPVDRNSSSLEQIEGQDED
jgi:ribose-phosphate pyrophosphokinase